MIFTFDARNPRICEKLKSNGYPIKRAIFELPADLAAFFYPCLALHPKKTHLIFLYIFQFLASCHVDCGHKKTFWVFADIINISWIAFICKLSNFDHRLD